MHHLYKRLLNLQCICCGPNPVTLTQSLLLLTSMSGFAWVRISGFGPVHECEPVHTAQVEGFYLRFSELNSDSRKRRNRSRPTGSFSTSSIEKPHLFTRCWLGSLLLRWGRGKVRVNACPSVVQKGWMSIDSIQHQREKGWQTKGWGFSSNSHKWRPSCTICKEELKTRAPTPLKIWPF